MENGRDVLVDEANRSLRSRGFAADEASVTALEAGDTGQAVLRGSLVEETRGRKGDLLLAISSLPTRDELVAMRSDLGPAD